MSHHKLTNPHPKHRPKCFGYFYFSTSDHYMNRCAILIKPLLLFEKSNTKTFELAVQTARERCYFPFTPAFYLYTCQLLNSRKLN